MTEYNNQTSKSSLESKLQFVSAQKKGIIILQLLAFICLLLCLIWGIGVVYYNKTKEEDYNKLKNHIDNDILENRQAIANTFFDPGRASSEIKSIKDNFGISSISDYQLRIAIQGNNQIKRYSVAWGSPFEITKLQKTNRGYDIIQYSAEAIGYKGEESAFYAIRAEDEPAKCYKWAFDYLIQEECKDDYITQNKSNEIGKIRKKTSGRDLKDFYFSTSYHSLMQDNVEQIDGFETPASNYSGLGYVYNDFRIVYYTQIVEHYIIKEFDDSLLLLFLKRGILISGILIVLAVIIFFSIPNFHRILSLYGKKWINTDMNKAIIFKHSWFSKCKLIEISPNEQYEYSIDFSKNRTLYKIIKEGNNECIFKLLQISFKEIIIQDVSTGVNTIFK